MSISSNQEYEDQETMDISVLSVITSDPVGDFAVPLFEFIHDESSDKSTIKLNNHVLKSLEDLAGNRPISVITICGQTSQGNSFMFSHIAKALEGLEKQTETDRTYHTDRPVQLSELKFESHHSSTNGIWVSRRPFIIRNAKNEEIAVLLTYSEGIDEHFTLYDDIPAIVGLSILMASVTIINFYDNLQEDFLAALNTYVQYGLLALENTASATVPFQKLKFLVQDWKMPLSYPYGPTGGTKFIQDALMVQPGQLLEAAQVRESIQRCFKSIDCFLMPHSGDKVINHESLTGSGSSAEELDPIYLENLVEFIKGLINIEALSTKQVFDKEITINELRTYLEGYLQVYNWYNGPSAQHLWKASLEAKILSFVNAAVKKFLKIVEEGHVGRNYLAEDELAKLLSLAEKEAINHFQKDTNFECTDAINQKKDLLLTKLEHQKVELTKKNAETMNKITGAISLATTKFRDFLDFTVGFNMGTDTFNFYDDHEIEDAANDALIKAIEYFKEKLKGSNEHIIESEEKTLRLILASSWETHKKNNEFRRLAAHGKMVTTVDQHAISYENQLEAVSLKNKMVDFDEIPNLGEIKSDTLKSFDKRKKHGKADFDTMYQDSLEKRMHGSFLLVKIPHNDRLKEMQSNINKFIGEEGNLYLNWLQDLMKLEKRSNHDTDQDFERINKVKIERTLGRFKEEMNPYPEDHPKHNEVSNKLQDRLQEIFDDVMEKAREEKERTLKSYQDAVTKAVEYYLEKMLEITAAREFLLGTELEESHNRIGNEAFQVYEQAEKVGSLDNEENFKQVMLINCIGQHYEKIVGENETKTKITITRARNLVHDCRKLYEETIARGRSRTTRQLEDCHRKAKEEAFQELREKCPGQDCQTFLREYAQLLEESIEKTFKEYNETFGLRLREEGTLTKELLIDCTRLYNEEMQKHVKNDLFISPHQILDCHTKAKNLVVGKLKEKRPLKRTQQMDVDTAMEELFQKYNLINNMKLNINKVGAPPIIGIDLGTTYTCVAVYFIDRVVIIKFENGEETIPSYVSFEKNGENINVGSCAKENSYKNPDDTIFDVKRILGRSFDDPKLQRNMANWPFTVVNDDGKPKIQLTNGALLSPEQVSAEVLKKCRESAESFLKLGRGVIKQAVVTVPAYFSDGQRQATRASAQLAGLEVVELLNEPTAAAIAYYQERLDTSARRVLVFDMGGGTHDVAVLDMEPGKIESLGSFGDMNLGGGDFDNEMMDYCCAEFKRVTQIDLLSGKNSEVKTERDEAKRHMTRIRLDCEKRKKQLSEAVAVDVQVDLVGFSRKYDLEVEVTQKKFEELNEKYFRRGIAVVEEALKKTKVSKESFDDVVLVGGSSKIPRVRKLLSDCVKGQALNRTISPDHAVAYGAAIKGAILNGEKIKERFGLDNLEIQDVIPFSLGIEVVTKELSVILERNSKIPVKKTKEHFTVEDNQTIVKIIIYEGEDFETAANNRWLGTFTLEGIPPAPKREEPIDVTMEIDGMGILEVSAVVRSTKVAKKIVVKERRLGMSKQEVDRILKQDRNAA